MVKSKDIRTVHRKIRQYLDILRTHNINIVSAYLFGSYAKGNATGDSDIDLAVVTKKFIGDEFDFQLVLMKFARDVDMDIEPHPYLEKDFTPDNPLVNEILTTGNKIED